jgi:multidrug resistance efflux pump
VQRFQEVHAGDVVAEIQVTDHRRYDTELEMLRGDIAVYQMELATLADRQRLVLNYETLRVDHMRQQTQLEVAKAKLPHAKFDVDLSKRLLGEKVVSEFEYHYFLSDYDSLNAQVDQLTKNVQELEQKLAEARPLVESAPPANASAELVKRLDDLQKRLKAVQELSSTSLKLEAPISGVVAEVMHRPGENIMPGESILTISSPQGERIVGYLRPPFSVQPKVGMTVEVRPRGQPRLVAESRISGVGASLEIVTNKVLIHPNAPAEVGLPVAVSLPPNIRKELHPGELVDMIIRPN